MSRTIALSQGLSTEVDGQDYEVLARHKWYAVKRSDGLRYAVRQSSRKSDSSGRQRQIHMHRVILGLSIGGHASEVDHINGNGLDNRRENLRLASSSQNQANRKRLPTNTSGFRGVTFQKVSGRWQAQIKVNGRSTYLGSYPDPLDAARAYDVKALELFGEFANLNVAVAA